MRKRKDGLFHSNWILGFQFKNVKETVRNWGKWWIVCFIIIITLRNWRKWWNLKIKIVRSLFHFLISSFIDFSFFTFICIFSNTYFIAKNTLFFRKYNKNHEYLVSDVYFFYLFLQYIVRYCICFLYFTLLILFA